MIPSILEKAQQTHQLTKEEILTLLSADASALFQAADRVRKQYVGDGVYLRGLIEFSNYCKNDCFYCGLRCSNTNAQRYRLSEQQIIDTCAFGRI